MPELNHLGVKADGTLALVSASKEDDKTSTWGIVASFVQQC